MFPSQKCPLDYLFQNALLYQFGNVTKFLTQNKLICFKSKTKHFQFKWSSKKMMKRSLEWFALIEVEKFRNESKSWRKEFGKKVRVNTTDHFHFCIFEICCKIFTWVSYAMQWVVFIKVEEKLLDSIKWF